MNSHLLMLGFLATSTFLGRSARDPVWGIDLPSASGNSFRAGGVLLVVTMFHLRRHLKAEAHNNAAAPSTEIAGLC